MPRPLGLYLAVSVEVGPEENKRVHELRVTVTRQETVEDIGGAVGALRPLTQSPPGAVELEAGEAAQIPVVIPLGHIALPAFGAYDVKISADGMVPRMLTVYLKEPPAGRKFTLPTMIQQPPSGAPRNRQERRHGRPS
jgi:hypothetical protein